MLDISWGLSALGGFYFLAILVTQWAGIHQMKLQHRWAAERQEASRIEALPMREGTGDMQENR